jgi:hypothetical protein
MGDDLRSASRDFNPEGETGYVGLRVVLTSSQLRNENRPFSLKPDKVFAERRLRGGYGNRDFSNSHCDLARRNDRSARK